METGFFVNFYWLCEFAEWDDCIAYAGEDEVYVRPDGGVVLMHKGQDIQVGRLTKAQVKALFSWYTDPGVRVALHVLQDLVGSAVTTGPCDNNDAALVRPHGEVFAGRNSDVQIGRLNAQQLATLAELRRRGDLPAL